MRSTPAIDLVRTLKAEPRSWSYAELLTRWSRNAVRAAVGAGEIQRVLPSRYAASEHATSVLVRAHSAINRGGPASVALGLAAAAAYGLCAANPDAIAVSAPQGARMPDAPWLRVRRTPQTFKFTAWNGLRIAPAADAVVTAFDDVRPDDAASLVFRSVQQRLTSAHQIRDAAAHWRPIRRRAALLQAVCDAEAGCESVLEAFGLRRVFTGHEFAHWLRQHRLMLDGIGVRLDMYDPLTRTAVELDGETYHGSDEARGRDARRDALLASHGILTVRFTSRDLRQHPGWCRDTTLRTVRMRAEYEADKLA